VDPRLLDRSLTGGREWVRYPDFRDSDVEGWLLHHFQCHTWEKWEGTTARKLNRLLFQVKAPSSQYNRLCMLKKE